MKVTDNSPLDLDQSDGQVMAKAPNGTSTVCAFAPPAGWYFNAGQGCGGGPAPTGQTTFVESWHVALLGTTFLAACDDSRPTEPVRTAAAPAKHSDARYAKALPQP